MKSTRNLRSHSGPATVGLLGLCALVLVGTTLITVFALDHGRRSLLSSLNGQLGPAAAKTAEAAG